MRPIGWLVPVVWLAACGQPDIAGIVVLMPEVVVAPAEVPFGDKAVPLPWRKSFFVSNAGRADLEVSMLLEDDAGVFSLPVTSATIARDESLSVEVVFTPTTYLAYEGRIVITTNDEDNPEVIVPLSGTGVSAPLPDIELSRGNIDFGEVDGEATEILTIRNVGTAPLVLGEVTRIGSPDFELLTSPAGNTLAPANELPVVVRYAPPDSEGDGGRITIASNDPDEGMVDVILLGNGGADYDYPVAVIDCPDPVDPPTFVALDGTASYDPEDPTDTLPLSYAWTLTSLPTDGGGDPISSGYITNDIGPVTQLWADAVGDYTVELVVENTAGIRSAPAVCEVQAIPDERLVVELTWNTPNADLDLHLAQTGSAAFQTPGDASWCNRSPNWGAPGTADDPALDLDDRAGYGPENYSILEPADGQYDVRVHYFDDSNRDTLTTATVRVYLDATLAFQASRTLAYNEIWDVARVNWPAATVGALSADPYTASSRQCP